MQQAEQGLFSFLPEALMCEADHPVLTDPKAIEAESFKTIDSELPSHFRLKTEEHAVIRRVIHATGDFDFAHLLRFSPGCFEAFSKAYAEGAELVTDVQMVEAGINKALATRHGGRVWCPMQEASVAPSAQAAGHTRAIEAMRLAAKSGKPSIVVIGNAPTALLEAQRLIISNAWQPRLIIGVPVGFVSAAESKHALEHGHAGEVPYITCMGRKGGSPVAAAIVNALLKLQA
jgi:precorrin-8X/cobalt-precorrin-8 methylmutase